MTKQQLEAYIQQQQSFLCVGLDTDIDKLPQSLSKTPAGVLEFNKQIITATAPYCVAYKINTAFYEVLGAEGWQVLADTLAYIPKTHFTIADAKRADIGNTSAHYAETFFKTYPFDSVTVSPYMGKDSLQPFLAFDDKFTIILGLTSNTGAQDFELQHLQENQLPLYQKVIATSKTWGSEQNTMYVVGATQVAEMQAIRKIIPDHFLLVPGVGFQGGTLKEVVDNLVNDNIDVLVNVSRAIIYASEKPDYAESAAAMAKEYQMEMAYYLKQKGRQEYNQYC